MVLVVALLQCVAAIFTVLQCVAVCCSMLTCSLKMLNGVGGRTVAVCCSNFQCVAVCCSLLQYADVFLEDIKWCWWSNSASKSTTRVYTGSKTHIQEASWAESDDK